MPYKILNFMVYSIFVMSSVSLSETSISPLKHYKRRQTLYSDTLAISTNIPLNQGMNSYETFQKVLGHEYGVAINQGCSPADVPPTVEPASKDALCPWHYVCDYDLHRIPRVIYHVKCTNRYGTDSDGSILVAKHMCKETTYAVPTLKTTSTSSDPLGDKSAKWDWQMIAVPVSCVGLAI